MASEESYIHLLLLTLVDRLSRKGKLLHGTMGKAWLPIIVAAIGSVLVDGSSLFRSVAVNEGSHGKSFAVVLS